jgi:ferrous iron transport protein A
MMNESDIQDRTKLSALSELGVGKMAIVEALDLPEEVGHHLMHMGFVPEARVVVIRRAPAGDPTVYYIDGFEIALRRETARSIRVRPVEEDR